MSMTSLASYHLFHHMIIIACALWIPQDVQAPIATVEEFVIMSRVGTSIPVLNECYGNVSCKGSIEIDISHLYGCCNQFDCLATIGSSVSHILES